VPLEARTVSPERSRAGTLSERGRRPEPSNSGEAERAPSRTWSAAIHRPIRHPSSGGSMAVHRGTRPCSAPLMAAQGQHVSGSNFPGGGGRSGRGPRWRGPGRRRARSRQRPNRDVWCPPISPRVWPLVLAGWVLGADTALAPVATRRLAGLDTRVAPPAPGRPLSPTWSPPDPRPRLVVGGPEHDPVRPPESAGPVIRGVGRSTQLEDFVPGGATNLVGRADQMMGRIRCPGLETTLTGESA